MRPTKNQYAMLLARVVSKRGTCDRKHVGCVIVDSEGHVLATGYNGASPGAPHCSDVGHLAVDGRCVRTVHAESNAVGHAARTGRSLRGSTAYVTMHPCVECAKMLDAAGVCTVVYLDDYYEHSTIRQVVPGLRFVKFDEPMPWFSAGVKHPGRVIVVEGIDGVGKTVVAKAIADHLSAVLITEPGGTEFGDKIRAALCDNHNRPCNIAMTLAYAAARAQLFHEYSRVLAGGGVIVSDRSFISSMVYQGFEAAVVNESLLDQFGFWPNDIVLLMANPADAVARINSITDPGGYDKDSVERHTDRQSLYYTTCSSVAEWCGARVLKHWVDGESVNQTVQEVLKFITTVADAKG